IVLDILQSTLILWLCIRYSWYSTIEFLQVNRSLSHECNLIGGLHYSIVIYTVL
ncbi:unnamed protein product, partial [Brassica oleracea]